MGSLTDPLTGRLLTAVTRSRMPVTGFPQPVEATIVTATTTDATVEIAAGGAATPVGVACPLPAGLAAAPAAGTRCLVVWSAQGNPWVVAVTDTPAP